MNSVEILTEAIIVQEAKAQDYGKDRSKYFPYDDLSYLTMMTIKLERLKELVGKPAVHESAMDSAIDLINYSSFYAEFLSEKDSEQ